jgi:hypothetical protein
VPRAAAAGGGGPRARVRVCGDTDLRVLAEPDEPATADLASRDEHLRREVPPHHGG